MTITKEGKDVTDEVMAKYGDSTSRSLIEALKLMKQTEPVDPANSLQGYGPQWWNRAIDQCIAKVREYDRCEISVDGLIFNQRDVDNLIAIYNHKNFTTPMQESLFRAIKVCKERLMPVIGGVLPKQEPLGAEFQKVLDDNFDDLLVRDWNDTKSEQPVRESKPFKLGEWDGSYPVYDATEALFCRIDMVGYSRALDVLEALNQPMRESGSAVKKPKYLDGQPLEFRMEETTLKDDRGHYISITCNGSELMKGWNPDKKRKAIFEYIFKCLTTDVEGGE